MSVTLSEVKRAAKAHRAPLAGESAGYLVLAVADQVLSAPRLVQAADVQLTEDGGLRVLSGLASSDADAELSLRRALDQLLLVASSGSVALTRASRRTVPLGLSSLVRELEAALIPVNRSAARRALARVHRETVRALANGQLPEEEPESVVFAPDAPVAAAPVAAAPVAAAPVAAAPVAAAPVAAAPVAAAPVAVELPAVAAVVTAPHGAALEADDDALTRVVPAVAQAPHESHLDGVISALCDELPAPPELLESDALTRALEVRSVPAPEVGLRAIEPALELEFDVDVVFEADEPAEAVDSSAAPTVMLALAGVRALHAAPASAAQVDAHSDQPQLDLPLEACTRPEPVVVRQSMRTQGAVVLPAPLEEPLPRTPTLGSLVARLPVLGAAQLAEINAAQAEQLELELEVDESSAAPLMEEVVCSAPSVERLEELTEQMPEVAPLSPAVAMVVSRKSDVSELLNDFHVAGDDSDEGLRRAIKEMAELDLTPAPFAALIR